MTKREFMASMIGVPFVPAVVQHVEPVVLTITLGYTREEYVELWMNALRPGMTEWVRVIKQSQEDAKRLGTSLE